MLGLVGGQVRAEVLQRVPPPPEGWNIVNKNLFLPILIVGSYATAPLEWAPICLVTPCPGNQTGDFLVCKTIATELYQSELILTLF